MTHATCRARNSLSRTSDFTPFGDFMISPIYCIHVYILTNLSVSGLCLGILSKPEASGFFFRKNTLREEQNCTTRERKQFVLVEVRQNVLECLKPLDKCRQTSVEFFPRHYQTDVIMMTSRCYAWHLSHICWIVTYESWRLPHVGQEMLTVSGTPEFTSFGEFMISPIHYTYIREFVSLRTMSTD